MSGEPNWEGLPGTGWHRGEHHTAGPHRAWCLDCREWCYANSSVYGYCPCCEQQSLPEEYRGLSIIEVIEKARADEQKRIGADIEQAALFWQVYLDSNPTEIERQLAWARVDAMKGCERIARGKVSDDG